jgi:hypothetical protein
MSTDARQMRGDGGESSLRFYVRKIKRHPAFVQLKRPLNFAKHVVPETWRSATSRFRSLPAVVIVGAQKAGTTQLLANLIRHPRVMAGVKKEVDFFSRNAERPVEWYRSHFPLQSTVARRKAHVIEASPSYMPIPRALRQMQTVLPMARVIVILRDPVSRAFSHYQHRKTRHLESRSFEQAVADELRSNASLPARGVALRADAASMWEYVARGYYALQLELLFSLYPRERVLVLDSADLFADTAAACQHVFDFLEVEPFEVQSEKVYNRGYYREKIDPRIAERLRAHYRPYDELLQSLLGRQFDWMRAAVAA